MIQQSKKVLYGGLSLAAILVLAIGLTTLFSQFNLPALDPEAESVLVQEDAESSPVATAQGTMPISAPTNTPQASTPTAAIPPTVEPAGTAMPGQEVGIITGTITIPEYERVPPGARLIVQLRYQEAVEVVLGMEEIETLGPDPIPFSVKYNANPQYIFPEASIALYAELHAPGRVPWIARQQVLTGGYGPSADFVLEPPATGAVTGHVSFPAGTTLPEGATLTIRLLSDTYNMYTRPQRVDYRPPLAIPLSSSDPVPFHLEYEAKDWLEKRSPAIYAEVRSGGEILLAAIQPLGEEPGTPVDILLQPPTEVRSIIGTAVYPETRRRPGSTLEVQVGWYSGDAAEVKAIPVATDRLELPSFSPATFTFQYNPLVFQEGYFQITVATVRVDGEHIFGGDIYSPMEDTEVEVTLVPRQEVGIITGTITIPKYERVPPGARLRVQLRYHETLVTVLGQQEIEALEPGPMPFSIKYTVDPQYIFPEASIALYAELHAPGRVPWIARQQVLTGGYGPSADLVLEPPATGAVTGRVSFPAGTALPEGATLTIRLLSDTYNMYTRPQSVDYRPLAIPLSSSDPVPFHLEYEAEDWLEKPSPAIYAEVRSGGEILLAAIQPLGEKPGTPVDILLQPPTEVRSIIGTAVYPETPLPEGATLEVHVGWSSGQGADGGGGLPVATDRLELPSFSPATFTFQYNPLVFQEGNFQITVAILGPDGERLFVNDIYGPMQEDMEDMEDTEVEVTLAPHSPCDTCIENLGAGRYDPWLGH